MTNSEPQNNYDPIAVEATIDDAYTQAEELGEYQKPVEQALGKIETLPYAVHGEGEYGKAEVAQTLEGLADLSETSFQPTMDTTGDALETAMEIFSHDPENAGLAGIMAMGENLENMDSMDRVEQANEYSKIIDQIGENVVEGVYEPVVALASEEPTERYNDMDAEEMVQQVAEDVGLDRDTFEQAAVAVAHFKGELT